jgi:two-component system, cell cycle response regulator
MGITMEAHNNLEIRVAPLGFEADVVEKLEKIFQRERVEQKTYSTTYPYTGQAVDIFLVNYDRENAIAEKNAALAQCPDAQVVAAGQTAITDSTVVHQIHPYQVHGILLAARLLSVLDKVTFDSSTPESETSAAVVVAPEEAPTTADSFHVLVVDDSPAIQKSLEINLLTIKNIGKIDFADSGEQALEKVENKQYDVIFLDVMMPGIDGYETCTQLRKKPNYKHTPIVMVSAKCSPLDEVKGIIAGCTTYLTKPVQNEAFQKLSHRMMEWLAHKKTT